MKIIKLLSIALVISAFTAELSLAATGGSSNRNSRLSPFLELIEAENYQQAIVEIKQALTESSDDPDLLNLYAYSHRKLGKFNIALDYYQKALKLDPDHLAANEYLGELYLLLGQLDKAMERLAILDDECFFGCDEFDDLEEAIEAYQAANPS